MQHKAFDGCQFHLDADCRLSVAERDELLDSFMPHCIMFGEFDAETRFNVRATRGASRDERGLELLQKAR